MMARRGVLGLFAGAGIFSLLGCSGRETLRYKMTVEVDTLEGLRSGYAVREVRFSPKSGTFFADGSATWKLQGEAVAVDIAPGKTLFALLNNQSGQPDYAGRDVWLMLKEEPEVKNGKLELWPNMPAKSGLNPKYRADWVLPMLVTFEDLNDPKSVERINTTDLAARFGIGVRLKRIVVEVTNEPVTSRLGERLASMGILPDYGLDRTKGVSASPTLAQKLNYNAFIRGPK